MLWNWVMYEPNWIRATKNIFANYSNKATHIFTWTVAYTHTQTLAQIHNHIHSEIHNTKYSVEFVERHRSFSDFTSLFQWFWLIYSNILVLSCWSFIWIVTNLKCVYFSLEWRWFQVYYLNIKWKIPSKRQTYTHIYYKCYLECSIAILSTIKTNKLFEFAVWHIASMIGIYLMENW